MKTINNILLTETVVQPVVNVQSPQNMTLKGTAAQTANPKRSKTILKSININLIKIDNVVFYKRLTSEIAYCLITFISAKHKRYNNYKNFFYSIFKILNRYSNKSSKYKLNKKITKKIINNIISYNNFITYLCEDFNNTFKEFNDKLKPFSDPTSPIAKEYRKDTKKSNKIVLTLFYNHIRNAYIKLISN